MADNLVGYRRANFPMSMLAMLNQETVSDDELERLVHLSVPVELTIKAYYSGLYNSWVAKPTADSRRNLSNLLTRVASRATKFQGFATQGTFYPEVSNCLSFDVNPAWMRIVGQYVTVHQSQSSWMKLQLNDIGSKSGQIYSWRKEYPDGKSEFTHIVANTFVWHLVTFFEEHRQVTVADYYGFARENQVDFAQAQLILETLVKQNVILTELDRQDMSIRQLIAATDFCESTELTSTLSDIEAQINKVTRQQNSDVLIQTIRKMQQLYNLPQPLLIRSVEKRPYLRNIDVHLPSVIKQLFRAMGVLSSEYQFGRAFNKMFAAEFGLHRRVSLTEAFFVNKDEEFDAKLRSYIYGDSLVEQVRRDWANWWLNTLTTNGQGHRLELKQTQVTELIDRLGQLADHTPKSAIYDLLYSVTVENGHTQMVLPPLAVVPAGAALMDIDVNDDSTNRVRYFAQSFPFLSRSHIRQCDVCINEYAPHGTRRLDQLCLVLLEDGFHILDQQGQEISLRWDSLMDTEVLGESRLVNRLRKFLSYLDQEPCSALPPQFNVIGHIPRITYKNVVLTPEAWNISLTTYGKQELSDEALKLIGDTKVGVYEDGNLFPVAVNTGRDESFLHKLTADSGRVSLYEMISGQEDNFTQYVRRLEYDGHQTGSIDLTSNDGRGDGQNEFHYDSYTIELPDTDFGFYLNLLADEFENAQVKNWFFIRYIDDGRPSIRLRVRETQSGTSIGQLIHEYCALVGATTGKCKFEPERHRYGRGAMLNLAFLQFEAESRYYRSTDFKRLLRGGRIVARFQLEYWYMIIGRQVLREQTITSVYGGKKPHFGPAERRHIAELSHDVVEMPQSLRHGLKEYFSAVKAQGELDPEYTYLSMIHMAHNRLFGINPQEEKVVHAQVAYLVKRGSNLGKS